MNQIAAITWSLATLLSMSACATREIQADEQPTQQYVAEQTGADTESELLEADEQPAHQYVAEQTGADTESELLEADEQSTQQYVAAQTGADTESKLPEASAAPLQTEPSAGAAKFGRALLGGLGGAVVGAFAPAAYLSVAGPIGVAVGLGLAPVGAVVGAVVGIAKSASR